MNESQTIPASELGIPDDAAASKLSADDIFRVLTTKFRRGGRICAAFFLISIVGLAVSIFYRHTWGGISAFVVCVASKAGAMLLHQKVSLAYRISREPQLVYWAHPCRSFVIGYSCIFTLHSRTGQALELATSHEEASRIATWLRQHNPAIRVGNYDDVTQTPNDRNA